jgi:hypothetical protein
MPLENNFYVVGSQQQYSTLSASSASGIVNSVLLVSSETIASCTASSPDSAVWVIDVVESMCSNGYYDYQCSTEKILCHSGFLQQNTANPCRFYILCPYFLATKHDAIKYVVSRINELGDCYAQSSSL